MSKILIYNTIDDFFEDIDSPLNKIERIKNNENNFLGLIDPENRLKVWLDLIPNAFTDNIKNFCRINRLKGSILIPKRIKVLIEYDTLFFAKKTNENKSEKLFHVTNGVLSIIRTLIYMYIGYNKKAEYHRGWINIAYTLTPLSRELEEIFILFAHLLETFKDFYIPEKNNFGKMKVVSEFLSYIEQENITFHVNSHRKISKSKLDLKDDKKFFISENFSSVNLLYLLKPLNDVWFGSLFSSILYPKDCLYLWDMIFIHKEKMLYFFGIVVLEYMNMELENIYEIQASSFINDFKIESKHDLFFYTIPAMLKHLSNYLSTIVSKNLFKDSLKKLSASKSIFTFLTPKKEIKPLPEVFALTYLKDRLKYMEKIIKKLIKGGMNSGMNLPRLLAKIDSENEPINLKSLFDLFDTTQTSISKKVIGRLFILVDQDRKGYLTKKELKNFLCLVPELVKDKLEILFKDEKTYEVVQPTDVLDILAALEYTIAEHLSHVRSKVEDLYTRIHRHFGHKEFDIQEMIMFMNKDPSCSHIGRYITIISGKSDGDESNISDEESETLSPQAKRGLIFVSSSNLSTTLAEKSRRYSTDATMGSQTKNLVKPLVPFNPSRFADKLTFEKTFDLKDCEDNWPIQNIPLFPSLPKFWKP